MRKMEGNIIFCIVCYMIIIFYFKNVDVNKKINYFNNVYNFVKCKKEIFVSVLKIKILYKL